MINKKGRSAGERKNVLLNLFEAVVRPQLEYWIQA
jgi:hypothetical protein